MGTWHSPVWSRRLAARPAHNGSVIASLAPLERGQWKPTATQAPSSEPSQSTGQAQAPTPSPGTGIQNRTWPGDPKNRPWFCQKTCQVSTKATGLSSAEQILGPWRKLQLRKSSKEFWEEIEAWSPEAGALSLLQLLLLLTQCIMGQGVAGIGMLCPLPSPG